VPATRPPRGATIAEVKPFTARRNQLAVRVDGDLRTERSVDLPDLGVVVGHVHGADLGQADDGIGST